MKLEKIEFELDNVINTKIELPLRKRKICLVGENGSGKSTFLYAINKMFTRNNLYIQNYFSLKEHQSTYTVRLPKKLKENFFHKDDFEVKVISKGYRNEFKSPVFKLELERNIDNLEHKYQTLMSLVEDVKSSFESYCNKNSIDSSNYGTALNYFLSRDFSYKRNLKDTIESIGEGILENRYMYNNIHELNEFDKLAWKLGGGYSRYQPELLSTVFSKFSKTGKIRNDKHLDYFNNSNYSKLLNLNFKIRNYNDAINRFNNVFGSYSIVYRYLNKNVLRNCIIIRPF